MAVWLLYLAPLVCRQGVDVRLGVVYARVCRAADCPLVVVTDDPAAAAAWRRAERDVDGLQAALAAAWERPELLDDVSTAQSGLDAAQAAWRAEIDRRLAPPGRPPARPLGPLTPFPPFTTDPRFPNGEPIRAPHDIPPA